jgi:hypothetical protein
MTQNVPVVGLMGDVVIVVAIFRLLFGGYAKVTSA